MNVATAATEQTFFTSSELASLDPSRIPSHIAIIPDGNRRWAKLHEEEIAQGHRAGADNLIDITLAGKELGVKTMTFYLFSTENWTRSREEVAALMWLLQEFLLENRRRMIEEGIKVSTIGNIGALPSEAYESIHESVQATRQCDKMEMVLALNYGARDEIVRAVRDLMTQYNDIDKPKEEITESVIARYLDTARWPDPELLIRTSGEMRLSNYLLWQLSYAEIYFSKALWPDFKPNDLLTAVADYQKRDRRLGGT